MMGDEPGHRGVIGVQVPADHPGATNQDHELRDSL